MNAFTPGPWKIDHDCDIFAEEGGLRLRLAIVDGVTQGEIEANARLIAAAPDLYLACIAMLKTWGEGDDDAIVAARDMAMAAVDEVGGGAP